MTLFNNKLFIFTKNLAKKILPYKTRESLKVNFLYKPFMKRKTFKCKKNLPQGINLIGIIGSGKSIGAHARLIAKALETANIPFCVLDFCEHFGWTRNNFDYEHKRCNEQKYNVNLIALNADCINHVLLVLDREEMNKRYNIGYWAWELAEFPDIWRYGFNCLQEVWANSGFCANSVAMKSPIPVLSVPLHAGNSHSVIENGREYFNIRKDIFLFMVAYDCNSNTNRKNPQAAVEAYIKAFSPDDNNVGLVIKIYSPENYQSHVEELLGKLSEYKNIYYFDKYLSDEEMRTLLSVSDSFVSLHRAEGFGLIPLEAMALGTPVVSTGWSGNMEYMNDKNAALVGYKLAPVNGQYTGTETGEDFFWAEPDIKEAANIMRRLVSDNKWRDELIENGKKTALIDFNPEIMGKTIRKRLQAMGLLT